jgi:hypothetical protein
MRMPRFLTSVIGWLRAGYPAGAPERGYSPLIALAGRLTEADVVSIADRLATDSAPASAQAIDEAIRAITGSGPLDADIARVSARLTAGRGPSTGRGQPG